MTRRLLPLRALHAFEAAARHLSFTRAAEELHVTPAAVSQQIKLLEEQLGQHGIAAFRTWLCEEIGMEHGGLSQSVRVAW